MSDTLRIYMKELRNDCSNKEESLELLKLARSGDPEAYDKLIKNYLLLVVKVARNYMNMGVPLEDLIAEGNVGLINAVEKFDFEKGAAFSTCAKLWIKQSITRNCLHKRNIVRLPENVSELMRTNRWKGPSHREISIDTPNDDGDSMAESIADYGDRKPFAEEENLIVKYRVEKALSKLKERDANIIKAWYGIGMEKALALNEIAELFGLTSTRINQIVRTSIQKMKDDTVETFEDVKFDKLNITAQPIMEEDIIIISAVYGTNERNVDVTEKVIDLFSRRAPIKAANRLGGDPHPRVVKKLVIQYTLGTVFLKKEFKEGSIVTLQ